MPTRRGAAAAAATAAAAAAAAAAPPTTPPLDGLAVELSGRFDLFGTSQAALEKLIISLGGVFMKSIAKKTTHLVTTPDEYSYDAGKVRSAKSKGLPIVSASWLLECEKQNTKVDEDDHSFVKGTAVMAPAASNGNAKANGNGAGATSAAAKKRPIMVANKSDDSDDEPQPKKTKGAKAKDNASVKDEENEPKKSVKEEKQVAEGQFMKKKNTGIPLDEFCPLTTYQVYIDPSSGLIYDAALNQSNSANNNNKFYRLQVIVDPQSGAFKTWTRWGRVGEMGQSAMLGNGTMQDAIKNFEKKFRDKSGLAWANRGDNPKAGKYAFVERSYDDSDDESEDDAPTSKAKGVKEEDEEEKNDYKPPECTLEKPVKELMELIFNQQYFNATMVSLNYDANKLPLGKLSKATITRGFQQLKDIAAILDDPSLGPSQWDMAAPAAIEHLSNTYYSLVPHAFGRNRPPIIRDDDLLKKEIEVLESLSDMKDAAELMKIDRKTSDTVHQLDRQFQGLGLEEMTTLDHKSDEFTLLSRYLNGSRGSTHNVQYKVDQIFRIERQGETKRFDDSPYASIASDRRLLWHGSRCTNFGGILSQGLRIAPPEAPVSGYMFGKGIYLADMSSKSAGYCASYNSNGQALLLLCEAELGDPMQKLTNASYSAGADAKAQGMHSTWGIGGTGPTVWTDAETVHKSLKGVKIPDVNVAPGPTNQGGSLYYNEFICYDVAQVKLRYLFRVTM